MAKIKLTSEKAQDVIPDIERDGLTMKQQKFIDYYMQNGGNGTEAYQKAYDIADYNVAAASASRMLKKVNISDEINNRLVMQRVTDGFIYNGFVELISLHKHGKGAIVAEKALEALAKMKGLMIDTKKFAFDGENPAVFLPLATPEESKKFAEEVKAGKRITE